MGKIYAECLFDSNGVGTDSSLVTVVGGIAPKSCTNLTCEFDDNNDVLKFKWTDIDDAYWGGVRLVIKKDSSPDNFTDGDIIKDIYVLNAHQSTPLEVPITDSGTYYATLFPFSTTGCVNSLKVSNMNLNVINTRDPISFATDDWDLIISVLRDENRDASTYYHTGDIKPLTCSDGNTYNMEIRSVGNDYMDLCAQELCPDTFNDILLTDYTLNAKGNVYHPSTGNYDSRQDIILDLKHINIENLIDQNQNILNILPKNIQSNIFPTSIFAKYKLYNESFVTDRDADKLEIYDDSITIEYINTVNLSNKIIFERFSSNNSIVRKKIINTDNYASYIYLDNDYSIGSITIGDCNLDKVTTSDGKPVLSTYMNKINYSEDKSSKHYILNASPNIQSSYYIGINITDYHKLLYFKLK